MNRTQEQIAFCDEMAFGTESLQLEAVAGSGKTTTIMLGLGESSVPPHDTLLLAFNKKIKEELEKRAPKGTAVMTLNGLGHRAWAKHTGRKPFLNTKKVGSIVSELCRDSSNKERHEYLQSLWADCKDLVSKAKAAGLLPNQFSNGKGLVADTDAEWKALADLHGITFNKDVLSIAKRALIKSTTLALSGEIDFDDQLYMPAVFRSSFDKFKLVIVDEAQDLSEIQHFLISRCVHKEGRLIAVGDPYQAIYGFRGALSDSMRALGERFQSKSMTLSQSFRCSKAAVEQAKKYVPHIEAAEGTLSGDVNHLGTEWTVNDIEEGSAVLCRNIAPLVKLGMQCIKNGVSAYVYGRDIGAPLIKACKHLNQVIDLGEAIVQYGQQERLKAEGNQELVARINDTVDALLAVHSIANTKSPAQLEEILKALFARTAGSIVLSTIHRAKGLEWNHVYILDFWRIPQKWILKIVKDSKDSQWMLDQEKNLAYIAVTRTKDKLTFINYSNEEETHNGI